MAQKIQSLKHVYVHFIPWNKESKYLINHHDFEDPTLTSKEIKNNNINHWTYYTWN